MSNLVYLLELEFANRIDDDSWSQYSNCWWIPYATLDKPSRVEVDGEDYTEKGSLALCDSTTLSWFWDDATERLYVHLPDVGGGAGMGSYIGDMEYGFLSYAGPYVGDMEYGKYPGIGGIPGDPDDPGNYIVLAFHWDYICDKQHGAPDEIVFNDKWYDPRLDASGISDVDMSVTDFHRGGVVRSFGSIKILNADSRYDQRLYDYIYEAKKIIMKVGEKGDAYGAYSTALRGWTRSISWNDQTIEIQIDDMREKFN